MTGKIKALGVAVLAVLAFGALSAITAPGASAAEFKCAVQPCTYTGVQEASPNEKHLLIGTGLTINCKIAETRGTSATKNSTLLTLTPTDDECTSSVGSASLKVNHCDHEITSATTGEHAQLHLTCAPENSIEFSTGGCTIKIGTQTPKGGLRYENKESGGIKHITIKTTLSGTTYTKSGFTCGFVSGEASYTGATTVKCYEDLSGAHPTGTAGTTPAATTHGKQVNCEYA